LQNLIRRFELSAEMMLAPHGPVETFIPAVAEMLEPPLQQMLHREPRDLLIVRLHPR
jgi:hypothetical protein